jgi:hypothetical protein
MKGIIFWDMMSCSLLSCNRHFGGTSPPSSGSKNNPSKKPAATWFHAGFLLCLFFKPEDGGNMFLRNVGRSPNHTAIQHKRWYSFIILFVITGGGIATGYGLDDEAVRVRVPVGSRIFSSLCPQTGSGAHPFSFPKGTGGFPRG